MKGLGELMESGNGRKVLTYLLVRRDQRFFCPDVSQVLEHGDGNASRYPPVRVLYSVARCVCLAVVATSGDVAFSFPGEARLVTGSA